jgi:hypothetical protein
LNLEFTPVSPYDEYRARLELRRAEHAAWMRRDARLAYGRLAAFGLFVLVLVLGARDLIAWWWIVTPVVAFLALVQWHDRVIRRRDAAARAIAFYERGLARIEDRWAGTGERGDRFSDDHHLYARDLDLFGEGSLFELLSIARTGAGEETLADWLKTPADAATITARQQAVTELTPALDLREALGKAGSDVREGVHPENVLAWAEGPVRLAPDWRRWAALLFAPFMLTALVQYFTSGEERLLLAVVAAQTAFVWPLGKRIEHVLHGAEAMTPELDVLAHLLERLERERFSAPRLVALRHQLQTGSVEASHAIRGLRRIVAVADWQHNLIFLMISAPFLVGTHVAWAVESWRRRYGGHIREWLAASGEFEALASLSAYRYEHPDDPYPEIVDGQPACFDGAALGHPLLASTRMVRNDVRLDATTRLLVVSGSNMSGKSTLLRTAGINAVLALAGAPVRARTLTLSPLAIGATLRIQDSLQEGRSRFYAEITRIRELAELGRRRPLLFLLDELFHGTNSHDRLVGASGVLRSLLDRGAIGLITTHDLALTAIADELAPRAVNVHFEDWFEGGEMRFDYRVKAGRVSRSNALALMRAVGLEVDP